MVNYYLTILVFGQSPLQAISEIVRYFKQNVRIPADAASNAAPPGIL